jgi:hypothetical protein
MADRPLKALLRELEQLRSAANWPRRPATTAPSALFVSQRMRSHKLPPPGNQKNQLDNSIDDLLVALRRKRM